MNAVVYKFAALIFTLVAIVSSMELPPRKGANCAYLVDRIYCYGGYIKGSSGSDTLSALDINNNNGQPYQNLITQWTPVTPQPTNIQLGFRGFPQAVALPDGKRFLFQGGYNYAAALKDQTIVYNAETNSWSTLPNYFDASNGGDRQIYYGTGVTLPEINAVGFYGGYQQHVQLGSNFNTAYGLSIPGLTFNNSDGFTNSYAGFYHFALLDLSSNTWTIPQQVNTPRDYHIMKSVTYVPGTKKIFYLGGSYYNTTSQDLFTSYLTYATTFDTTTMEWKYEDISGTNYPGERVMHTATLLSDGENILLYGGTYDDKTPVVDYCYTLNVPKMQWTYRNLNAPVGVSGPRAYHSAVLVNNTSLFILFGMTQTTNLTNDLLVLDVRNVNNLAFADRYPFDQTGSSSTVNNDTKSTTTSSSGSHSSNGLGTGAIVGIAVGCAIAGILTVAAIIFFVRRNKKKHYHEYSSSAIQSHDSNNNRDNSMVDMNWDRMDAQQVYREIDPSLVQQHTSTAAIVEPPQQSMVERPHQEFSQQQYQQRVSIDHGSKPSASTVISPDGSHPPEPPHAKAFMQVVKPDSGF